MTLEFLAWKGHLTSEFRDHSDCPARVTMHSRAQKDQRIIILVAAKLVTFFLANPATTMSVFLETCDRPVT